MIYKNHLLCATITTVTIVSLKIDDFILNTGNLNIPLVVNLIVATALPDIDNKTSTINKIPLFNILGQLDIFEHRGFFHTLKPVCILLILGFLYNKFFYYTAFYYFLHLFLDSFSKMGILWFGTPFENWHYYNGYKYKKNHKFKFYKVGHKSEKIFIFIYCFINLFVIYINSI